MELTESRNGKLDTLSPESRRIAVYQKALDRNDSLSAILKKKVLAVVLILAASSIVGPTKSEDRVIDSHSQEVCPVLENVG